MRAGTAQGPTLRIRVPHSPLRCAFYCYLLYPLYACPARDREEVVRWRACYVRRVEAARRSEMGTHGESEAAPPAVAPQPDAPAATPWWHHAAGAALMLMIVGLVALAVRRPRLKRS